MNTTFFFKIYQNFHLYQKQNPQTMTTLSTFILKPGPAFVYKDPPFPNNSNRYVYESSSIRHDLLPLKIQYVCKDDRCHHYTSHNNSIHIPGNHSNKGQRSIV